jgi:chromosome segregation ATPase
MGVLVVGAAKVEEEMDRLKRNLRAVALETKAKAKRDQGLAAAWQQVEHSLDEAQAQINQVVRKIEPHQAGLQTHLRQGTKSFLDTAEVRARRTTKRMIERAIEELERLKRRLDKDSSRAWHAA